MMSTMLPSNKDSHCTIAVAGGHKIYICNKGDTTVTFKPGVLHCGFTKGKWQQLKSDDPVANAVIFKISGSDDLVMFNGTLMTVGEVVAAQTITVPMEEPIKYHHMTRKPKRDDPAYFETSANVKVAFVFNDVATETVDGNKEVTQASLASTLPADTWNSSLTQLVWSVKWGAKGLHPNRPQILVTSLFEVPSKSALLLSGPSGPV